LEPKFQRYFCILENGVSDYRKAIPIAATAISVLADPVKRASFERIYFFAFVAARAMNPVRPSHLGKKLFAGFLGRKLSIKGIYCFHTPKVTQKGAGVNTHLIAFEKGCMDREQG